MHVLLDGEAPEEWSDGPVVVMRARASCLGVARLGVWIHLRK